MHKRLNLISLVLLSFIFCYSQETSINISNFNDYNNVRPIEKIYLHLDKPYYAAGEFIYLRAYLTNAHLDTNVVSRIIYVELSDVQKRPVKRILLHSDKREFAGQIHLPDSLPAANYHLRAYTNWMRNAGEDYFFHRDIFIRNDTEKGESSESIFDYQVVFFPEGGHLIANAENRVAFKALGNDGFGIDVTGVLTDDAGNILLEFASTHLGMGKFSFVPQTNRTYKITTTSKGIQKQYTLPKTTEDGLVISATQSTDTVFLIVKSANGNPEPVSIIGQSRQTVCYALQGVLKTKQERIAVPKDKFPTGIAQFTLFKGGLPVSERLIFIDRNDDLNIQIIPEKEKYGDREKAKVDIQVKDKEGKPVKGSFSLSVTDDKVVTPSVNRLNIKGSLLLESDLKGYIENPGWFFNGDEPERKEALDILLCTQGWSRYSWEEIKTDHSLPVYQAEDEFKVTGQLVNALGRPVRNGTVLMLSNVKTDLPESAVTNSNGRFGFIGFNNPDTTVIVLQGRNRRNSRILLDLKLDKPDNKSVLSSVPLVRFSSLPISSENPTIAFIEQAILQKKYDENLWTIDLPEVEVVDKRQEQKKQDMVWRNMFSKKLSMEDINDGNMVIYEMRRLGKEPVMLMLDGVRIDTMDSFWIKYLETTPASFFESIELVSRTGASMWGSLGEVGPTQGIFILKTRSPKDIAESSASIIPTPGLVVYKPEGYCVRREFYIPEYDKPEVKQNTTPDLRTTIYWNPVTNTNSEGKASVEFFTADNVRTYSYVLEGIGGSKIGFAIRN